MARAATVASMLASSRSSGLVEIADFLAGLYISDWDRLSQYWDEENLEDAETLLRRLCSLSPQRWNSWLERYDGESREGGNSGRWRWFRSRFPKDAKSSPPRWSEALLAVLEHAKEITPLRDAAAARRVPVVTCECILLCIARTHGSELSRKLAASGLDTTRLEREVLFPRRSPLV